MPNMNFMPYGRISLMVETNWSFLVKQKSFPYLSKLLCSAQGESFGTSISTSDILMYWHVSMFLCETLLYGLQTFFNALKVLFMEVISNILFLSLWMDPFIATVVILISRN